jgi:3-carboxy-cis,cis-muconate cycloisomerase
MPSTIIDSPFLRDLYGTPEMRNIFSDQSLLQKWLDVEAALARAEAELGIIPEEASEEIFRKARVENINSAAMKALVDLTVHPIIPLIRVLQQACMGDAGEYIHWGATTQDIMDTAMVLQLKEATAIIEQRLSTLEKTLETLAITQRETIMAGRTHGQQALPITFGYKVAIWLAEIRRHTQRLEQLKPRLLIGQFGGAVGTLASLGEQGLKVQARMMEILGLGIPLITWHTSRDGFSEFTALAGMIAATMGKIAHEIISLQRTEISEVEEPFAIGKIGSSTMPHKRNPMLCEAIQALAHMVIRQVPLALDGMIQEHERDWSCDHIEWGYLGEVCIYTDGALNLMERVLNGLRIYPDRMRKNLEALGGLVLSEAVMLALAEHIGRQRAHEIVYTCAMRVYQEGITFREALDSNAFISKFLSPAQIDQLLDPRLYTGLAKQFVDRVVEA